MESGMVSLSNKKEEQMYKFNGFKVAKGTTKYATVTTYFSKQETKWVKKQARASEMSVSAFVRELVKRASSIVKLPRKPRTKVISGVWLGKRQFNKLNAIGKESGMKRSPSLCSIVQEAMKFSK